MAFHFDDPALLAAGIDKVLGKQEPLTVLEGDDRRQVHGRFPFAEEVLLVGMWPDFDDNTAAYARFMEQVTRDQARVSPLLQAVVGGLLDALDKPPVSSRTAHRED